MSDFLIPLILCDGILQEFKRVLEKKVAASPDETSEALIILSEAAQDILGRTDSIGIVQKVGNVHKVWHAIKREQIY
jgi:hypothetical protein